MKAGDMQTPSAFLSIMKAGDMQTPPAFLSIMKANEKHASSADKKAS